MINSRSIGSAVVEIGKFTTVDASEVTSGLRRMAVRGIVRLVNVPGGRVQVWVLR